MQKKLGKEIKKTIKRLSKIERMLEEWENSKKPILYIDEETALLSSLDADVEFIKRKIK